MLARYHRSIYRYLDRVLNFRITDKPTVDQWNTIKTYRFSEDNDEYLNVKEMMKLDPSLQLGSRKKREAYTKELKRSVSPLYDILNEMEAFAAVVTSGVLDEYTVYRAIGSNYVHKIQNLHLTEVLVFYSKHESLYTNVSEVYELWDTRLTVEKAETGLRGLERQSEATNSKIKTMKERVGKIQTRTIQSIGVSEVRK